MADSLTHTQILAKLNTIAGVQRHHEWLLHAILNNQELYMSKLDDFITSITTKMDTLDAGVESLKPFIQGLFDEIAAALVVTPTQQASLDGIEARIVADSDKIAASMLNTPAPPVPPVA